MTRSIRLYVYRLVCRNGDPDPIVLLIEGLSDLGKKFALTVAPMKLQSPETDHWFHRCVIKQRHPDFIKWKMKSNVKHNADNIIVYSMNFRIVNRVECDLRHVQFSQKGSFVFKKNYMKMMLLYHFCIHEILKISCGTCSQLSPRILNNVLKYLRVIIASV